MPLPIDPVSGGPMTSSTSRSHDPADDLSGLDEGWLGELEDDAALRLYLSLVRLPNPTVAKLAAHGVPTAVISESLPVLERRGMIEFRPDGVLIVTPPDIAVPAYVAALERRARSTRRTTSQLHELYTRTHIEHEEPLDPGRIDARALAHTRGQVIASAVETLIILIPGQHGPHLADVAQALHGIDPAVDRHVVADLGALEAEGALDALLDLQHGGVDVRLAPQIPHGLLVVDQDLFVIDVAEPAATQDGEITPVSSFVIRHRALAASVKSLAQTIAAQASPLSRSESTPASRADVRTQHILALLAAGATDTVIARQVRVSQRTVERHIRQVMDSLGASTRFQAGVQAARRGLVRTDGPPDKV